MHAFGSMVPTSPSHAKAALQLAANVNMAQFEVLPKFDLVSMRDLSITLNDGLIQFLNSVAVKLRLTYGDVVGHNPGYDIFSLLLVAYPKCKFDVPAPPGKELTQMAALVLIVMRLYIRELTEMSAKLIEAIEPSSPAPQKS